ncbi:MAG: hypothetical protein OXJ64_09295 [Boseongicola sp.]|nr:hypothetical protein [Boseongicola sp.]
MSGPLAIVDYQVLTGFFLGACVVVWSIVMVTGFFPRTAGPVAARGLLSAILLNASILAILALLATLAVTTLALPWAVSVIAAGLAILGAPFLVQFLPTWFRNSRLGLLAVLVSCAAVLFILSDSIPL